MTIEQYCYGGSGALPSERTRAILVPLFASRAVAAVQPFLIARVADGDVPLWSVGIVVYFMALATDFDGTIAVDGSVLDAGLDALRQLKRTGCRLVLVTGRELPDLLPLLGEPTLFDLIVAENGALLFDPASGETENLGAPAPDVFIERLRSRDVSPLSVGSSIVATTDRHKSVVLDAIHELGLDLQIVFNKGALMILPANVNKSTGMGHAAKRLQLSLHNIVAIGDAENDIGLLQSCGCGVAVANALDSVKQVADLVVGEHAAGVAELAHLMMSDDLARVLSDKGKHHLCLGTTPEGMPRRVGPLDFVIIGGSSGAGKSTLTTALIEQMRADGKQFCIVDPEGDYSELPEVAVVGSASEEPLAERIASLLARPEISVVANLLAIDSSDRPRFLAQLMPEIARLRAATGRPHWLVVDEAHQVLPAGWYSAGAILPTEMPATVAVTMEPAVLSEQVLNRATAIVGLGEAAWRAVDECLRDVDVAGIGRLPRRQDVARRQAVLVPRGAMPVLFEPVQPRERQRRHERKYAEGELGADRSFFFRGPEARLNLRAHNLSAFLSIADGVDDETWLHHLRQGHFSEWFRECIKDDDLADATAVIERTDRDDPGLSRARISQLVTRRYTAAAR